MATSKKEAKQQAKANKAVDAANKLAIVGFDPAIVTRLFEAMANGSMLVDGAREASAGAALEFVQHAESVRTETLAAGGDCDSIVTGWSKNVKTLLPRLAAKEETRRFVKVKDTEGKDTKFTLTGYGANVNSIARGLCQFDDISVGDCESYGQARELVMNRRAEERSDDEKLLAEAKQELRDALKEFAKVMCKTEDMGLIIAATNEIQALTSTQAEAEALVEEVDDAAQAA